jgi:hypothetical protein
VRVRKLLRPHLDAARDDARTPDALAGAQADSVATPFGKPADAAVTKKHAAYLEGFSLHAWPAGHGAAEGASTMGRAARAG